MEPVNIIKEVVLDLFILLAGLIIVSAEGVATSASKGLSCGNERVEQLEVRQATPEEASPAFP